MSHDQYQGLNGHAKFVASAGNQTKKCALLLHFMMQVDFALVLHLYLDLTNFYTSWQHSWGCEQLENT